MPIFDEDSDRGEIAHDPPPSQPIPIESPGQTLRRKCSEESIRTELCEGMLPDSPGHDNNRSSELISDRAELIERLKRGESPTWAPNHHQRFESLFLSRPPPPPHTSPRSPEKSPPLLPAADITPEKKKESAEHDSRLEQGLEIERPGSALHSGDFRDPDASRDGRHVPDERRPRHSEDLRSNAPWTYATSPPRNYAPFCREHTLETPALRLQSGPPSLSSSFSSSRAFQPPTSPLVQSESNDDLELQVDGIELTEGNTRIQSHRHANLPRRHTLTSHSSSYGFSTPTIPAQRSIHRRQGSYQAHQPQRPLPNLWGYQPGSPQPPAAFRPRRPSFSSDISPIQHASMVGSYEESILRGRMSTTPSKPLDFLAQIGVLGLGNKCKKSLRCPPHVTLPFPAVFYSYSNALHGTSKPEDEPSPYVGQIDLETGLPNPDAEQRTKRKTVSRMARGSQDVKMGDRAAGLATDGIDPESKPPRTKRRSGSPKCPPGGSYRIPEKGQIQIIIKNPNKTAVKLFLVPYDLSGMDPGTKTFIRQRSYSAGPIVEGIPVSGNDKPTLRYLVHLHICSPGRGRYYLYKTIRVVFANRVPDGKEKLRNEVTYPEPRFSPYKPIRAMNPPFFAAGGAGAGATLAMEKAFRRRSSGFSLGNGHIIGAGTGRSPPVAFGGSATSGAATPIEPIPFGLPPTGSCGGLDDSSATSAATGRLMSSSLHAAAAKPAANDQFLGFKNPQAKIDRYDKLSKGDVGYGGNAFYSQTLSGSPATESLLSEGLRSLGVQQQREDEDMEKEDGNNAYFEDNGGTTAPLH